MNLSLCGALALTLTQNFKDGCVSLSWDWRLYWGCVECFRLGIGRAQRSEIARKATGVLTIGCTETNHSAESDVIQCLLQHLYDAYGSFRYYLEEDRVDAGLHLIREYSRVMKFQVL